tara:strand:- start:294 stop:689 length:396 start_codon:yes stop_codon:yes gene_type:complete
MEEGFKLEIINPEKIIFSGDAVMVTLPSYEGDMSILKNHISIITFLRPGIVKVQKKDNRFEDFFVQDGTIEFLKESLIILSASVINLKNISNEFLSNLRKDTESKLSDKNIADHDRYILSHKLDVIKDLRI